MSYQRYLIGGFFGSHDGAPLPTGRGGPPQPGRSSADPPLLNEDTRVTWLWGILSKQAATRRAWDCFDTRNSKYRRSGEDDFTSGR